MLDKTLEDHNTDFKLALAWCVNAKNPLANIHSFSPFQLDLGQNPNYLQYFMINYQHYHPSTQAKFSLIIFCYYIKLGRAYIASESSEKIRRTLNHNVRTSGDIK